MPTNTTEKVPITQASEALSDLMPDPVRFVKGILGHRTWSKQRDILSSVAKNSRTAVKACHASSKTYSAAEIALWWVTAFPDGVVITTAPIFKQVRLVMWGEIHKMVRHAIISYPKLNQTELRINEENYLIGLSTSAGVNLQGYHGKILVILDEAVGIANDIFEAIEGIRAGGDVRMLALGNPTVPGGAFYDAFQANAYGWSRITITAFDSPNIKDVEPTVTWPTDEYGEDLPCPGVEDQYHKDQLATLIQMAEDITEETSDEDNPLKENRWPFLITKDWVVEKWYEWGKTNNPLWYSRVLGQFPPQADDALISMEWINNSKYTETKADLAAVTLEFGIDVAGPGEDETVLLLRQGDDIILTRGWKEPDPRQLIVDYIIPYGHRTKSIRIDSNGIGWGFFLHIRDTIGAMFPHIQIVGINVGAGAFENHRFANLKAELYWNLRERFAAKRVRGLDDETMEGQLLALRYEIRPDGRVKIESKEDMRARGVPSPDRAEALMLAFADVDEPVVERQVEYSDEVMISLV